MVLEYKRSSHKKVPCFINNCSFSCFSTWKWQLFIPSAHPSHICSTLKLVHAFWKESGSDWYIEELYRVRFFERKDIILYYMPLPPPPFVCYCPGGHFRFSVGWISRIQILYTGEFATYYFVAEKFKNSNFMSFFRYIWSQKSNPTHFWVL